MKVGRRYGKGKAVFARKKFRKGEIILPCIYDSVKDRKRAKPESVQIGRDKFIETEELQPADFINHACEPNAKLDLRKMAFIALKEIEKGEEITYHYMTTDYDLVRDNLAFDCRCGSKGCLGKIEGFKFLSQEQKLRLKPLLSPFLIGKLEAPSRVRWRNA